MTSISILQRAVEQRHGCFALLREIVSVRERRADGSTLDAAVVVFSLAGHPSAEVAYAWCDPGSAPDRMSLHVALHSGVVSSPVAAVRLMTRGDSLRIEQVS